MRLFPFILSLLLFAFACDGESDSEHFRSAATKGFGCVVVEVVDSNVFEEGLGSIYDFDKDGFGGSDSDSLNVSLRKSDLSVLKSRLILNIGQMSFGLHDANDTIAEVKEKDAPTERVTFQAKRADLDQLFTVRLFSATRLGIVLFQNVGAGAKELKKSLVEDCKAEHAPKSDELKDCLADADSQAFGVHELARVDCRKGVAVPDFDAL